MDKIAMYEMLLEDHPLWTKEAGGLRRVQRIARSGLKKKSRMSEGLEEAGVRAMKKLQRRAQRFPGGTDAYVRRIGLDPSKPPKGATSLSEALLHANPKG